MLYIIFAPTIEKLLQLPLKICDIYYSLEIEI